VYKIVILVLALKIIGDYDQLKISQPATNEAILHAAKRAEIIGSESTANLALASGVKEDKIIPVKGGEDYDFQNFSVRVIPSLHTPLNNKHLLDTRVLPRNAKVPIYRYIERLIGALGEPPMVFFTHWTSSGCHTALHRMIELVE
jgi:hypothetical protein